MKHKMRLLAALLSAALLLTPALAAEDAQAQSIDPWAYPYLADSYALGLVDDNYTTYINNVITDEQLTSMTKVVSDKLALLDLAVRSPGTQDEALVIDQTRGGVVNALYQAAADWDIPGLELGAEDFLASLGVLQGDGSSNRLDRLCTYQEAMVLSDRLILAVYDENDAGSKGLLWKATNGDTTLYLLGTIHIDRNNVYPMHSRLRNAIDAAQEVIFEVNFNDPQDLQAYAAMQVYTDGTTLKDHIPEELYTRTVNTLAQLGMDEATVASCKPWVLGLSLSTFSMQDETSGSNAMAIDLYVNAKAINSGKTIAAAESMAYQGQIFDTLSQEYQLDMLTAGLDILEADGSEESSAEQEAILAEQNKLINDMMEAWKSADPAAFEAAYDKKATVESTDELSSRLFTERDPGMIEKAAEYLARNDGNTYFMAVGAGHMVDPGGIVSGLEALGYTVSLAE